MSFLGFDQALTRNINGWERYGEPWLVFFAEQGMKLYDGDGEPVLEVGECQAQGGNDIMYPGCWNEIYADRRPGCRDLISSALGIDRAQLTGMLSFFVNADVEGRVYKGLQYCDVRSGDFVSFQAMSEVAVGVSACPDDTIPGWRPAPLHVAVERAG